MTARDRWTEDVECSMCGKTGTVHWSEADGYIHGDPGRSAKAPEGFHVVPGEARTTDTRIVCTTCNVFVDL